jgi:hypothetical protein
MRMVDFLAASSGAKYETHIKMVSSSLGRVRCRDFGILWDWSDTDARGGSPNPLTCAGRHLHFTATDLDGVAALRQHQNLVELVA